MIKIRKLTPFDINKFKKMIDYVELGLSVNPVAEGEFTFFPFDVIHDFLPINIKFLQECYVAVENSKILGLIGLQPDGYKKNRWKINRLILHAEAYDHRRNN